MKLKREIGLVVCLVLFAISGVASADVITAEVKYNGAVVGATPLQLTVAPGDELKFEVVITSVTVDNNPFLGNTGFWSYNIWIDPDLTGAAPLPSQAPGLVFSFSKTMEETGLLAFTSTDYIFNSEGFGKNKGEAALAVLGTSPAPANATTMEVSDGTLQDDLGNAPEFDPVGQSLGFFVVKVMDETAYGPHVISDVAGESFLASQEIPAGTASPDVPFQVPDVNLVLVAAPPLPEPATMSLLVLGGLSVLARRRRR